MEAGRSQVKLEFTFSKKATKARAKKAKTDDEPAPKKRTSAGRPKQAKPTVDSDAGDISLSEKDDMYDSDSEPDNDNWEILIRTQGKEPQAKRPKVMKSRVATRSSGSDTGMHVDNEIIELSSD